MTARTALELQQTSPPFRRAYRIVPSRFPPVGILDQLVDPDEIEVLAAIEARTNDRLADELGLIDLVAPADRVVGPGSTPIMAAFTHPPTGGSRFTDGSFGIYYCADAEQVAIEESAYHRSRFLRATNEAPCHVEMRLWVGNLQTTLHNGLGQALPQVVLDPNSYSVSQAWGDALRNANAYGLLYPSVRHSGGQCAALFRPPAIDDVVQGAHYHFQFDGHRISRTYKVSQLRDLHSSNESAEISMPRPSDRQHH